MPDGIAEEESYYSSFSSNLYRHFPRFIKSLKNQQPERGRAAVIEFKAGERAVATYFTNSKDLRTYFDDPTHNKPHSDQIPRRRLWLLEDISKNYITALGSRFHIPPSFFAAHWADPSGADFNERDSFDVNPGRQFLLKFPQFHRVSIDIVGGDRRDPIILMDCNIERYLFVSGLEDTTYENPLFVRSYHCVSFWSSEYPGGSWDAILLIDPPLTESVLIFRKTRVESQYVKLNPDCQWDAHKQPPYPSIPVVECYSSKEAVTLAQPLKMLSMFDDIVFYHHNREHNVNGHSKSCTVVCRKIVIANWIAFLRHRYLNMLTASTLASVSHSPTMYVNRTSWLKDLSFPWEKSVFGNLINARFKLEALVKEISGNMAALGLVESAAYTCQHAATNNWEINGWREVLSLTSHMMQMLNILTQAYQHAASIQEAQTGNELARSLAKLTNIAMIFTPISVVSGFFSMGGSFSPGGSKFWVFWAVSCPIVITISVLVWWKTVFRKLRSIGLRMKQDMTKTRQFTTRN